MSLITGGLLVMVSLDFRLPAVWSVVPFLVVIMLPGVWGLLVIVDCRFGVRSVGALLVVTV